jgi:DHA1 family tetracycline resistance protein-like MFS transporter
VLLLILMQKQKRVLPVLFATLLLDMIGTGMIIPIIPILFTDPTSPSFMLMGYSVSNQYLIAGLITALFGLMQFIASPILGELSDVYGRKKLLTLGVATLAIAQMLFGFGIGIMSLWILLISRAIAGLAGANFSIAQAAIADVSEPHERAKNFGLIGAAFGIGFILGPLLGGWIAHLTGSAASPFWFAGILGVFNTVFITLMLPETHHNRAEAAHFHIFKGIQNIITAFRDKQANAVYFSSFLYMSGFAFLTTFSGILAVSRFHFTAGELGTYFGAIGVFIVITQIFILGPLTKRFSEKAILRVTLLVLAASVAVYPFVPNVTWLYLLIPFLAIPQGLSIANIGALISKSVSPEKQGAALGINGSLIALSQGVIPILAGVGSGVIGLQAPFVIGGLSILFAWSILFFFKRKSA